MAAKKITLETIAKAGTEGMFVAEKDYAPMLEEGLVEINLALVDKKGKVATRITQKGIESIDTAQEREYNMNPEIFENPETSEKVKKMFEIETGIELPAVSGRGRGRTSKYPFDKLEVGQSFFVADEGDEKAAAKLASTVSSATRRFSVDTGEKKINRKGVEVAVLAPTRKFVTRTVEGGARVWRTE